MHTGRILPVSGGVPRLSQTLIFLTQMEKKDECGPVMEEKEEHDPVRGTCSNCNEPVKMSQERSKDDEGNYYHLACAGVSKRGVCCFCGYWVLSNQDRGQDPETKEYFHLLCCKPVDDPEGPSKDKNVETSYPPNNSDDAEHPSNTIVSTPL